MKLDKDQFNMKVTLSQITFSNDQACLLAFPDEENSTYFEYVEDVEYGAQIALKVEIPFRDLDRNTLTVYFELFRLGVLVMV